VRFGGLPAGFLLVQIDLPVPPDRPAPALILGPFGMLAIISRMNTV
jgi:hypothetical protein